MRAPARLSLAALLLLVAGAARAQDTVATAPAHADDPVAAAQNADADAETAAQIDAFVKAGSAGLGPERHAAGASALVASSDPGGPWASGLYAPLPYGAYGPYAGGPFGFGPQLLSVPNDGKLHGEVGGVLGTGGLRGGYASVIAPIDDNTVVGLSISDFRYGRR